MSTAGASSGMQLTRLRVEQLRQFRVPYELAGLLSGLNILHGPNEAGKSTLVRAIRAAFFERHRSTAVEDLRPWGDGAATPTVALDFMLDGQAGSLTKAFLSRKRCHLRIGLQTLEGVEAEDTLARLFGFAHAGRGASQREHWGIPGLLWVEQGGAQELREATQHARQHLHDALRGRGAGEATDDAATGELAATGGDAVLARLRSERDAVLTAKGGKPRGAYAEALEQIPGLEAEVDTLAQRVTDYRAQVDRLAGLQAQHAADERERPWAALGQQLEQARAQEASLQVQRQQMQVDESRQEQIARQQGLLTQQLADLAAQEAQQAQRKSESHTAEAVAQRASVALSQAEIEAVAAEKRMARAQQQLQRARQIAEHQDWSAKLRDAEQAAQRLYTALAQAEAATQSLASLQQESAQHMLTPAQLDALRTLERNCHERRWQRDAAATRLRFTLEGSTTLELVDEQGARRLQGSGEHLLTQGATLRIPGQGELHISPGGQDLQTRALAVTQAEESLAAALRSHGLRDLPQAEASLRTGADLQARIKLEQKALVLIAPTGVAALGSERAGVQARESRAREALATLPTPDPSEPVTDLASADAEHNAAQTADRVAREALASAGRAHLLADQQHTQAQREAQTAGAVLDDPERRQRLEKARHDHLLTQSEAEALAARIRVARASLQEARPDIVAQDIRRLTASIAQLREQHQRRHEDILVLRTELHNSGAQGLEERHAEAESRLAQARRRADELACRARALELLCRMLEARRENTLARLRAPLQHHMQRYLPLLFAQASLTLDEHLAPATLSRANAEAGDFEHLSFGAREQLGLVSRFAYADLLRESGRPTLLILDDALVHSDAARLALMKRVVFDAAERHQVLLFTCHPEAWRDMGVAPRALRDGDT